MRFDKSTNQGASSAGSDRAREGARRKTGDSYEEAWDHRARREHAQNDEAARERARRTRESFRGGANGWRNGNTGGIEVMQHLATLGINDSSAEQAEIKKAYRMKALLLHPDRQEGGVQAQQNAQEFKRVTQAYAWLEENYFVGKGTR